MSISHLQTRVTKESRGRLATDIITTDLKKIYQVDSKVTFMTVNINIVNDSDEEIKVRVWLSLDDTPNLTDLIEPGIRLSPGDVYMRTSVLLCSGEKIFMKTDKDQVIARIEGLEDRTF